MKSGGVAVLVAALALAGCSGDPGPGDDGVGPGPAAVHADHGDAELAVVVVDDAIRPLAGATVVLDGLGLEATSDAEGGARFTGLAAGAYVLHATLAGYFPAQAAVTVEGTADANARPVVVTLVADDTAAAYVEVVAEDVFVEAAFIVGADGATEAAASNGGVAVPLPSGVPDWVQTEANWDSTQPLGSSMYINYFVCGEGGTFCNEIPGTKGPSPIVVATNGTQLVEQGYVQDGDLSAPLWAVYEGPGGVGLVLEQAVRMTTHKFYGYAPPTGWLFSRDGTPGPPA